MAKVRSRLERLRRAAAHDAVWAGELGLPCSVCGAPATGWTASEWTRNGAQVIDGTAVCAAHLAEAEEDLRSKAG